MRPYNPTSVYHLRLPAPGLPPAYVSRKGSTMLFTSRPNSVRSRSLIAAIILVGLLATATTALCAGDLYQYKEATFEKGQLNNVDGLAIMELEGTPDEIGRQAAALTSGAARELLAHTKRLVTSRAGGRGWPILERVSRPLLTNFPIDHRKELQAFARMARINSTQMVTANVMVDVYRMFGCSSLVVEPSRSTTDGPLFGRNLDFYTLGVLHRYTMVTICRPDGKHAFASIGFPGLIGTFSGMNDAGLALAVHEVSSTKDGSLIFDKRGTPYALCFRRILEECTTIEEAELLLKGMRRTTRLNLVICDREKGGVLEITPQNVVLRRSDNGLCACTNHFRTSKLTRYLPKCKRYAALTDVEESDKLGIEQVAEKLHAANMGRMTLQTMIFEPKTLKLHLAAGSCPSSAEPLREIDLSELLKK
jgi:isopenicillin-N N-acyltransferase-like protein